MQPAPNKVLLLSDSPTNTPHPSVQPNAANFWRTAAAQGHSLPQTDRGMWTDPDSLHAHLDPTEHTDTFSYYLTILPAEDFLKIFFCACYSFF